MPNGQFEPESCELGSILPYNTRGMASLAKTNKYLRTEEMRLRMAAKTSLNCSVIEGARGIRKIKFVVKDGKIVRLDESRPRSEA